MQNAPLNIPESRYINKISIDFGHLPHYMIKEGIVRKFERGNFRKQADYQEWKSNYLAFLETVPQEHVKPLLEKGLEYAGKVFDYHLQHECDSKENCTYNESWERRIAIVGKMLQKIKEEDESPPEPSSRHEGDIPILPLTKDERLWMEEVYERTRKGLRFTFKDIWSALYDRIAKDFRPLAIDERLTTGNGETIRLLGVIAVEKNFVMLETINKVINVCREKIIADPSRENIDIHEISDATDISPQQVSIALNLAFEYGEFYTGSSVQQDTTYLKSIRVSGSDHVYYQYIQFEGIEKLMRAKIRQQPKNDNQFSATERKTMDEKIDFLMKEINDLKTGHQIIWEDFMEEMQELKKMYPLGKKNWKRMAAAKIVDMTASGIIGDTVSKKIVDYLTPLVGKLINGIREIE